MKQYLSMLLFDRKNLRFSDFVRLQQLEAQLGALAFDGVGDEQHRLELMHQYNATPLVCAWPLSAPPPPPWTTSRDGKRRLRARVPPANTHRAQPPPHLQSL